MADPQVATKLPENAYRELKPGETYVPMVPPNVTVPEITRRSIIFGLVMNVVFSVAATFLALKAGQGIETAIPISILAVGLSGFLLKVGGRASSILENVYILAISTTSGYVAGGTCFTMPAIYVLSLDKNLEMGKGLLFLQIALVPFLGAILGSILLIPFRRYFVKEMHGKLPFPEATATNEIVVTGASGSTQQAWVLIYSFVLAAIYTFAATALKLFCERFTTGYAKLEAAGKDAVETLAFGATGLFADLTTKVKAVASMGAGAYYLGLGVIIGPRYASIICAGSFLSCFAIVPLLAHLNLEQLQMLNPGCVAHAGPAENKPRFALPIALGGVADKFDPQAKDEGLPEPILTTRSDVRTAFAGHGVSLAADTSFRSRQLSRQWEVQTGKQTYVLEATDTDITVRLSDAQTPAFALPSNFTAKLDGTLSPNDRIRAELGSAFAGYGYLFGNAAVGISVVSPGQKWILKDKHQTYELRAKPEANEIAVFARQAGAEEIFNNVPKNVGIGVIFTAGILSILKMSGVIVTALRRALGSLFRKRGAAVLAADRTDEDLNYGAMLIIGILVVITMAIFFRTVALGNLGSATWLTFMSVILALVIAFLFTTVSAWAIAMISVTPISGMTVTTIIITAVLLSAMGLPKGDRAMLAVLLVGGVVCTALSLAGGLITNFKLAYWLGANPRKIVWHALAGSIVSAVCVCGTIMILAFKPGYTGEGRLDAPQANMMASALGSFLGTGQVPWLLYGVGVMIALTVQLLGVSPLAFGLGMYLPMYINTPILVGAFVATLIKKSTKDEAHSKARSNRAILIASGLIAGGAIIEVLVNFTAAIDDLWLSTKTVVQGVEREVGTIMPWLDISGRLIDRGTDPAALARFENWLGLVMFLGLCVFLYWDCRRAKPDETAPEIRV
jgi:uncharacterized oligopeptide transporter (OPT) family protein